MKADAITAINVLPRDYYHVESDGEPFQQPYQLESKGVIASVIVAKLLGH